MIRYQKHILYFMFPLRVCHLVKGKQAFFLTKYNAFKFLLN